MEQNINRITNLILKVSWKLVPKWPCILIDLIKQTKVCQWAHCPHCWWINYRHRTLLWALCVSPDAFMTYPFCSWPFFLIENFFLFIVCRQPLQSDPFYKLPLQKLFWWSIIVFVYQMWEKNLPFGNKYQLWW